MKPHFSVEILLELTLLGGGTLTWAQEETPPLPPSAQQPQMQQTAQQGWSPQKLNNPVAAPQGQRLQSQPQQRDQAPQQYWSARQVFASPFSSGGSFSGRHGSNGAGGHRR